MRAPAGFRGTFRSDETARALYSEGAGPFRIIPAAVALPADAGSGATANAESRGVALEPDVGDVDGHVEEAERLAVRHLDFPQERVAADINGDGFVDFADLLLLLAAWGPCE